MPVKYGRYIRKKRGTRVCGYGRIGQHRNKGQRGGVGMYVAKGRQHRTKVYLERKKGFPDPRWMIGHRGFHLPPTLVRLKAYNPINIKDVESQIESWVTQGKAEKRGETYVIDLEAVDYQKLLGNGQVTKKLDITVNRASEKAVQKMKDAGCKLTVSEEAEDEEE
jgi:large subunit ribosomal protein L15